MLTDEQIAEALALVDKRYQKVTRMYLEKVGATINDIGKLTSSRVNIIKQLHKMGIDSAEIYRELQRVTNLTKKDINKLYYRAVKESLADARELYRVQKTRPSPEAFEHLVKTMWMQTAQAMDNLSNTTAISGAYQQIVDEAVQAVTMGVGDYQSEIRKSVRLLGRNGLQVRYESGYHRRLDTAVRQNILDGTRQIQQQAQKIIGEQIGADGVEISAHPNSAPDHEPVQGRQFALEEFRRMQSGFPFQDAEGNPYSGFPRPITEWNCRHLVFYIILGVSKRIHSEEQLKAWEQENQKGAMIDGRHYSNYECTQLMRKLETEIRREKDTILLAEASGDDVLKRQSQVNLNRLKLKYGKVAEAAGLKPQYKRTVVEGFKNKHTGFTEKDLEKYREIRYHEDGTVIVTDDWTQKYHPRLEAEYLPNAVVETLSRNGKQIDRMFYDASGRQVKQVSNGPHTNPKKHPYGDHGEHCHDILWKDGKIFERPVRGLTDQERKENADIL